MAAERPFATDQDLCAAARRIWDGLVPADWLEAFAAHPPIGGRATSAWSAEEQADAAAATPDVRAGLAEGNRLYARTFGYTFLVCASGRSAVEMLTMMDERLMNTPEEELLIAAAEQRKITELRLKKLITS
jgi:OHCU decarboxylase